MNAKKKMEKTINGKVVTEEMRDRATTVLNAVNLLIDTLEVNNVAINIGLRAVEHLLIKIFKDSDIPYEMFCQYLDEIKEMTKIYWSMDESPETNNDIS